MKHRISFQQYRTIDLTLFAAILFAAEFLIVKAATVWYADQLYSVYVRMAGETVILKTDPHEAPDTDSDIVFTIPRESVCLFDGETGKNVEDKTNSDPSGITA